MTIEELKAEVSFESVLETLVVTAYNATLMVYKQFMAPSFEELPVDRQERFRQSVYLSLPRASTVNSLEKLLRKDVE